MGLFGNKDALKKKSNVEVQEVEDDSDDNEENEEEEDEEESGNCSLNIYTLDENANVQLEYLTIDQLNSLKKEVTECMSEKSLLNLEKYKVNQIVNGSHIISFDWEDDN